MAVFDWEEAKFDQEFENALVQVKHLRKIDPDFTIEKLRSMLDTAYVHQGNNWTGRGAVGDVAHEALIAAYQQYLAQWEKELESKTDSAESTG